MSFLFSWLFSSKKKGAVSEEIKVIESLSPRSIQNNNSATEITKEISTLREKSISPFVSTLFGVYLKELSETESAAEEQQQATAETTARSLTEEEIEYDTLAKEFLALSKQLQELEREKALLCDSDDKLLQEKRMLELSKQNLKKRHAYFYCTNELETTKHKKSRFVLKLSKNPILNYDSLGELAATLHYRMVESQFFSSNNNYQGVIRSIEYVMDPVFQERFERKKKELAKKHGFLEQSMKPFLLFHGSSDAAINAIMTTNFKLEKIASNTGNTGYYGKGFYFSYMPSYSMSYCKGNTMLACLVLTGKAYVVASLQMGIPLTEGYDSHTSPDGCAEVVIFHPDQVLPCYKITFDNIYYNNTQQASQNADATFNIEDCCA